MLNKVGLINQFLCFSYNISVRYYDESFKENKFVVTIFSIMFLHLKKSSNQNRFRFLKKITKFIANPKQ